MEEPKVIVLLSGGLDSLVCLHETLKVAAEVKALFINYGQRHSMELQNAKRICKHFDVQLIELDLTDVFRYSNCSLLEHSTCELPQGDYAEQVSETSNGILSTYVPFRNGVFLSAATALAQSIGYNTVVSGMHASDSEVAAYPDCSLQFVEAMAGAVYLGTGGQIRVWAPLVNMTKTQVVELGISNGTPMNLSRSCYADTEEPCGVCGTCIDRKTAIENATKTVADRTKSDLLH